MNFKMNSVIQKYNNMPQSAKASCWFMICSIIQKGISFITVPIFTRILSASEYGAFSTFLSWEGIVSIFVTLNLSYQVFNNGMVKYDNNKDDYTTSMVGLTLVSASIIMILSFIFKNNIIDLFKLRFEYIIFMIVDSVFVAIYGLWIVRERYEFKYRLLTVFTLASAILNPLLGIIFIQIMQDHVLARLLSIIVTNFATFIIAGLLLLDKSKYIVNGTYWKYALKLDIPLIPHYLSMILLNNSDRIMISKYCGEMYTAFYSVAYNAAMIMQIVITSINSSFNPWLYQQLKEKRFTNINKTSNKLLSLVAIITVLPVFFSPEIMLIMGSSQYADAISIMPPLACSVFLIYLYTLFSNIEMFYEKPNYIMIGSGGATFFNIVLNLIFIKYFGYKAAAYTTLICYILLSLFHFIMMKKICKKNNKTEEIYNSKFIVALTGIVFILSFLISLLFNYPVMRYTIIVLVCLVLFCVRKKIVKVTKEIKFK